MLAVPEIMSQKMCFAWWNSFRTLLTDCPKLIIPLVNEMFSERYDTKDTVTLY